MRRYPSITAMSLVLILFSMTSTLNATNISRSEWMMEKGTLTEVESLFTKAHQKESLPPFRLPSDETWSKKSDAQKMLFMIDREREARGIRPLKGVSRRINEVSQAFAERLLDNKHLTHRLDGKNSWMRLQSIPEIAICMNRIDYAENLALFGSQNGYQKFYIERAVFAWMYDDERHGWRHRSMLLYDDFSIDDSDDYVNGLIGVGVANKRRASGHYVVYIVLNYVDPCPSWQEVR